MDNDTVSLNQAKRDLKQKNFSDALPMLERLVTAGSKASGEAAYCLGILYQSGNGVTDTAGSKTFCKDGSRYSSCCQ